MSPALNQQRPARWTRLNHDYQFTPTTLNNFRVGYTREPQKWFRVTSDQGFLQKTGLDRGQSAGRHRAARTVHRYLSELGR